MATRDEAEAAIYDAIVANASAAKDAEKGEAAEAINELARAYAQIVHGPQGGATNVHREAFDRSESKSESHGRTEYTGSTDYHETRHAGEERERPGPGFGGLHD